MEPNKLENYFRKQFSEREIKPSEASWERLEMRLSIQEKPKKKFSWLFMAASMIGFVFIGTIFITRNDNQIKSNNSVAIDDLVVQSKKSKIKSSNNLVINEVKKSNSKIKKDRDLSRVTASVKNNINQIAEVSISNQKSEQKIVISQTNQENLAAIVPSLENDLSKMSDINQKSRVHVDAGNLLSQVDGELELSFREKVIGKINKNYQTIKVALANRNQQE
jgi:hypothetical protein